MDISNVLLEKSNIDIYHNRLHVEQVISNTNVVELTTYHKENKVLKYIYSIIKRTIDILAGIVGLILLIPLTMVIWIANKINHDNGPIFYVQERIGKDGKKFKMLKYRSMVIGAEEKLQEYLANNKDANEEYRIYKKLTNDPRVTKIGKILRKTSLDEFPQLINVLTGSMSLVGPRPYLPNEIKDMGEYYNIIIKDKPGIAGLWQCRGRSNATFEERLDLDVVYYKKHSLKYDIHILLKTLQKVVSKDGAI